MEKEKLFFEAINQYQKGNYKKALKLFLKYSEFQNNCLINYNIGVCYIEMNEFNNAILFLKKALFYNKYNEKAYINLAYCYYKQKDYKAAYRIIKEGAAIINSNNLISMESKLFNIIINGGKYEFNKKAL